MERGDRQILSEFIDLYCNLPCLWDIGSDLYKDKNQKSQAWQLLADILQKIEPAADIALAKKKIDHMRTAYKREEKKIKESKRTGSGASDMHVPSLWYYDLLNPIFNNKDEQSRTGIETLTSDEEDSQPSQKKIPRDRGLERKKHKLIETAQKLLSQTDDKKPCSFGVYVGEQLEQVNTFQRQVAEKLISEVLFLAKTGNLQFDTKIVSSSGSHGLLRLSDNISDSPSPLPQFVQQSPSPQYVPLSPTPQFTQQSPSPQYIQSSPSPKCIQQTPPPKYIMQSAPSSKHNHTTYSSQPKQASSRKSFSSFSAPRMMTANGDERVIQRSMSEGDNSVYSISSDHNYLCTTTSPSSQCSIPSSSPKYIRTSAFSRYSHTPAVTQLTQVSSSKPSIMRSNEDAGVIRFSSPRDDSPLHSVSTEEIITYEPTASVLKKLLSRK